ncbi:zona pellucida sperm-binding protein 1-like [Leptodactylus fuscus]|uniref:zona pellucida sperm-binding protein 1-like n=1 Tax=Leptodactylus fuscus TaxID=238119 RepID=UPI003F4E4C79
MVAWKFFDGLWLLLLSMWPLLGSCSTSAGADYKCGEEGVQLHVAPGYLGGQVFFQVRDEFDMGYDLQGCLSKCLLSTQGPNGESVFYSPYSICLSVRKDGEWLLRVRLVGRENSEDLNLICPKPKLLRPKVISRTHKPSKTRMSTTGQPSRTTPYGTTESPPVIIAPPEDQVTTRPRLTGSVPTPMSDKLTPSQCSVPTGKITCLNSTVSRDMCLDYRCCHDPTDTIVPCYYGHTVTVHCFPDGLFQLILSRHVTSPPLRLSSVVLGPGTCPPPTILGDFLQFQGDLSSCSARRFFQGRPMYELSLTAKPDVLVSPLGSITRDSSLSVLSQCLYNNTLSNVSLVVLAPQPPTVTSTGVLSVELRISRGPSFSSFYAPEDFPLQIPLRELVFLEARLLQPSDPRLHLRLHQCWGAPSTDPASTVRWPVIQDGCPFSEDDTLTKILPASVPSGYRRFAVSAFTFVGFPYNTQVYFFCSVSVCLPSSSESCALDCADLTRSRRAPTDLSVYGMGSAGPLVLQQDEKLGLTARQFLTSALPGILLAVTSLLMMLLLAFALKVKSGFMTSCPKFDVKS